MALPVILLVEDNPDDVLLTTRALRESKVANEIVVQPDGAAALDYLLGAGSEDRPLPQVILLDLRLPKMTGLELLAKLRSVERTRRLPVVILTSSDEERDVLQGYDLGANSYVRKPVEFHGFIEAVRQLGLYWLVINEPPPAGGGR